MMVQLINIELKLVTNPWMYHFLYFILYFTDISN